MISFRDRLRKASMFSQNKYTHNKISIFSFKAIVYILLFVTVVPYDVLYAKNTIFPFENTIGPIQINEYFLQYPHVPFAPQNYEIWLEETKSITQYLGFNAIDARVKYLDKQDTTYFEYVMTDSNTNISTKGKLFVRITGGSLYQVLDVRFVPYFNLREITEQQSPKQTDIEAQVIDKEVLESQLPASLEITELANASADIPEKKDEIPEEDYEDTDPIQYPQIIPSIEDAIKNSTLLFLDVAILDDNQRKKNLFRFNNIRAKLFTEQYVYTSKGALQRLVRSHVNGTTERFVYYFSTGGLKEVFYQDKDGSSYVLRYTIGGDLSEKQIRNKLGKLEYDERNNYTKKGTLISRVEVEYKQNTYTENNYKNGKIVLKKVYTIRNSSVKTTEQQVSNVQNTALISSQSSVLGPLPKSKDLDLLYEENFRYNNKGDTTGIRNRDVLNERITISQYDDEGILLKEKYFLNSELEYEVIHGNEEQKQEIFYFKNNPILKIYYQKNSKIREEVLKDGKVVETRQ